MNRSALLSVALLLLAYTLSVPTSAYPSRRLRSLQADGDGSKSVGGNSTDAEALSPDAPSPAPAPADDSEGEPCSIEWYQAHGWLMWTGFGFLMPVGIIMSRHMQAATPAWFHIHSICMALGMVCVLSGGIIAFVKFEAIPDTPQDDPAAVHVYFGLAVFIMACINFLLGVLRPHKGSMPRVYWYAAHFTFGTCGVVFAWYCIFSGMDVFEENWSADLHVEKILFAIQVAVLGYVYLFLGRWTHLLSQSDKGSKIDGSKRSISPSTDLANLEQGH